MSVFTYLTYLLELTPAKEVGVKREWKRVSNRNQKKNSKTVGGNYPFECGRDYRFKFFFFRAVDVETRKGDVWYQMKYWKSIYHLKIYGAELAKLGPKNRFCNILKLWVGLQVGSNFPMNDLKSYKAVSK